MAEKPLEGFLEKQGVGALGKGYKRRWFSQKGSCLYYYKDKKDSSELGFINLAEAIGCNASDKGGKRFQINTPRRIWHLQADSEDMVQQWVNGIKGVIDKLKNEDGTARLEQMNNRVQDLEGQEGTLRKALDLAAKKLGTTADELIAEAEGEASAKPVEKKAEPAKEEEKKEEEKKEEPAKAAEKKSDSDDEEAAEKDKPREQKRFKAKVLYDYTAQQDYEMTIRVNEEITVLSKHGNGWWLGATADGKQGYFPGSYVEPLQS